MSRIFLEDIEFYAYHGCFKEEQTIGTRFLVSLLIDTDVSKAVKTDALDDTIDYQSVALLVKKEMMIPSTLLAHVAGRILDSLFSKFPEIDKATVKVSTLNPPVGVKMKCVSVEVGRRR